MITKIWVISYVDDNSLVKHFDLDASIDNMINSMQRSLHEWHKILQITGGDLCLEKCTLILMKWKQVGECGNMVLASKKDDEKNLTITSVLDTSNEQQLKRIDPHQAERVLGIRLPLTGKMTIEMNFRKEQLLDFCKSLYKAPLSHYEAHVAYQSRYKSIAKYPFPITTFSSSQLDEIQKPSICLLLPKLGLNRNMPRAVIFGPRALGGLELMNLKVEQPAINIQTTIGHLRREDRAADILLATFYDLQIEVEFDVSVFQLNPSDITYVTPNTRWLYTWIAIKEINAKIQIWDEWVPSTDYVNDKNIMQTAVNDEYYKGRNKY